MKDFELTLKLRNNLLKQKRLCLGLTIREISEQARVSYGIYCAMEGLRWEPIDGRGRWKKSAVKLAKFHGVPLEDLWSDAILSVKNPTVVAQISGAEARAVACFEQQRDEAIDPERLLCRKEDSARVQGLLTELRPYQRKILMKRFAEDQTLGEIARSESCSVENIRRIEAIALGKLRNLATWQVRKPQTASLRRT